MGQDNTSEADKQASQIFTKGIINFIDEFGAVTRFGEVKSIVNKNKTILNLGLQQNERDVLDGLYFRLATFDLFVQENQEDFRVEDALVGDHEVSYLKLVFSYENLNSHLYEYGDLYDYRGYSSEKARAIINGVVINDLNLLSIDKNTDIKNILTNRYFKALTSALVASEAFQNKDPIVGWLAVSKSYLLLGQIEGLSNSRRLKDGTIKKSKATSAMFLKHFMAMIIEKAKPISGWSSRTDIVKAVEYHLPEYIKKYELHSSYHVHFNQDIIFFREFIKQYLADEDIRHLIYNNASTSFKLELHGDDAEPLLASKPLSFKDLIGAGNRDLKKTPGRPRKPVKKVFDQSEIERYEKLESENLSQKAEIQALKVEVLELRKDIKVLCSNDERRFQKSKKEVKAKHALYGILDAGASFVETKKV